MVYLPVARTRRVRHWLTCAPDEISTEECKRDELHHLRVATQTEDLNLKVMFRQYDEVKKEIQEFQKMVRILSDTHNATLALLIANLHQDIDRRCVSLHFLLYVTLVIPLLFLQSRYTAQNFPNEAQLRAIFCEGWEEARKDVEDIISKIAAS